MTFAYVEHSTAGSLVKQPVVSVVMPAYNHERYLAAAIEGVVGQQTDFPFELIVGNDGSADRTKEIALSYQARFPQTIRVLSSEIRAGMHENDARVLSSARGKYMAFCEGDDWWHRPDKLKCQVALLECNSQLSLVCSSWRIVSEDGSLLVPDLLTLDKTQMHPFQLEDILNGRVKTVTVCTKTGLIQRALRESPLCRKGRYPFADAPLWVEASRQGDCVCLPDSYATYRLSANSATRPKDVMDVYRFIAGASEFDRDVLGLYPLRQGERAAIAARIDATRKRLRALAFLGEAAKVREELVWLCQLGAQIRFRERLLYWASVLSQPGSRGASSRGWMLAKWHGLVKTQTRSLTSSTSGRPEARRVGA